MQARLVPVVVLVLAAAALVGSLGWALTRADAGEGWSMHRYGAGMMVSAGEGRTVETLEQATEQAQRFADRLELEVGEVMRFSNHYYAELREEDGSPATEVLVDPRSGAVFLEYGPAMMWNTRYGMMSDFRLRGPSGMMGGGMMGGAGMTGGSGFADPTWAPSGDREISAAEARQIAGRWLDDDASGLAAGEGHAFPGYYTFHVLRGDEIAGMLSVNGTTGAVWYHWWHGSFVSMLEE
jgi:hypothetical protein